MICENNSVHRKRIRHLIENTILREEINLKITLSSDNPEKIIYYIKKNNCEGIYFLDVDLKNNMNGIRLGEKIREMDPEGFIIFITTHLEMSYLAFKYKVEAMDYIIKDDDDFKERVSSCLMKAYNTYCRGSHKEGYITINEDARVINLKINDILFIETAGTAHKLRIHEENRQT